MEIKIGKPGRSCCTTERDFVHGEQVVSLVRIHDQAYSREDYAEEAWDPKLSDGAIAVWTTTYIDPKVAEQEPEESYSPLRQIFYEAVVANERNFLATAYLAAELLRRQKVFRLVKQSVEGEEEGRVALYNDRIANRLVEVRDPNLSLAELEAGRKLLVQRLQELEAPEEPAEAEEAAGAGSAGDEELAATEDASEEGFDDEDEFGGDEFDDEDDEVEDEADDLDLDDELIQTERVANGDV